MSEREKDKIVSVSYSNVDLSKVQMHTYSRSVFAGEVEEKHIHWLLDKIGFYALLVIYLVTVEGFSVTRNAIGNIIEESVGKKYHASSLGTRLDEFEEVGLVEASRSVGATLYRTTEKGKRVTLKLISVLEEIDGEAWSRKMEVFKEKVKIAIDKISRRIR